LLDHGILLRLQDAIKADLALGFKASSADSIAETQQPHRHSRGS